MLGNNHTKNEQQTKTGGKTAHHPGTGLKKPKKSQYPRSIIRQTFYGRPGLARLPSLDAGHDHPGETIEVTRRRNLMLLKL